MNTYTKQFRHILKSVFLISALAACAPSSQSSNSSSPNELYSVAGAQKDSSAVIQPNFQNLSATQAGSRVTLHSIEGVSLPAAVESVENISSGNYVISGRLEESPLSQFTIVVNGDAVSGTISSPNLEEKIEIGTLEGGVYVIHAAEVDAPCGHEESEHESSLIADEEVNATEDMSYVMATPTIDMLVAYTPNARSRQGGTKAIQSLIQLGIAQTNQAFSNSGLNVRVRLVGMFETTRNESGNFNTDLARVVRKGDGYFDELHTKREQYGADQVTFVGAYTSPTQNLAGVAYNSCWTSSGTCSSTKAFTVVRARYFSQYTFTHEFGHNLGLNHWDGHVSYNGNFQTLMAKMSYGERRILLFSSPSIRMNGYLAGSTSHNSVRIINKFASTFAKFRAEK